ncbi:MAG: type II toxin-antitoxin system RelE/ParE family toxin [Gallionella sp.]|nr:type II toxin-antitoxin system RelE/ParE family toxin [Gallionella sp.]
MSESRKKQLEWSILASADVLQIEDHIAAENPLAAKKVTSEILDVAQNLRAFPMLGHLGRRAGTREIVIPHYPYFISYRLTPKKVIVLAVLHQSRQYP